MMIDPKGLDGCDPGFNLCSTTLVYGGGDSGLVSIPESWDPEWCNPVYLAGCLYPFGTQINAPPPYIGGSGGGGGGGGGGGTISGIGKALKKAVCSALPQGRTESLNGSLGLLGGQTGSLSVVINYQSGQVSGFATGGLQVGWNGAAATSVSTGFIYGNLGSNNGGYSGPFVTGYGSGPVFGGYASFSNGVSVYGASMGANLTGGAGGGANFTETTAPHQFGPVVGSLFKTPLDNILSLAKGLACHH